MINEIMKRLSELPNVTLSDGQEYIQLYDAMETVKRALEQEPSEEYKRGWQDAITTALNETHNYYTEDGVFKAIQEESLIGVGMSMQEPSGDLISRQDAIKAIDERAKRIKNEDTLNGLAGAVGILFDLPPVNPQEPKYCDRNICMATEYNGIGCDECEVTKSQEPSGDAVSRQAILDYINRILNQGMGKKKSFEFIHKFVKKLPSVNPQEPKYCDRNICMATEYNGIGCDECEVQEPTDENLHREREQAYMQGYEDASKRFRQESCEDAISREEVLLMIDSFKDNYGSLIDLSREVRKMPPVNSQRQTGHWIEKDDNLYVCSECGQYIYSETEHDLLEFHAFCGNCGARMIEPQEMSDKEGAAKHG